ncbi:MAG: hypothetical protein A2X49_08120 [Lentisphaerae bacterium GWF2_52_8]|nr:MAG: hypothetical protein A2X49_08120 [Lentisphaerae bacterium GWF2_52_8]
MREISICVSGVAAALLFLLSGCQGLRDPGGQAPDGPIVQPAEAAPAILNEGAAVNRMITALSIQCNPLFAASPQPPVFAKEFSARSDSENELPEKVLAALTSMRLSRTPRQGEKADYVLRSEIRDASPKEGKDCRVWTIHLVPSGSNKSLWEYSLLLEDKGQSSDPKGTLK